MKYPYLAAQLFNVPLMARPETAEVFASAFVQILVGQANIGSLPAASGEEVIPARESFASNFAGSRFSNKRYIVTDSGIGILPVYGALAQRAGEITPDCTELTSYQRLGRTFDAMVADPDVRGILLEVDSPGGQVAGNFELARKIMGARGMKPVWAHANEMAFSGGYSLAAAAERFYAPDTGMVGSVGVMMLHMSQAERDARSGYQYTAIFAGARKNDMNPHFPLSEAARARLQAMVDSSYEIFVQHVASARGMKPEAVRATEAGIFEAKPALDSKLIDGIYTFAETLAALESRVKGVVATPGAGLAAHQPQESEMSETTKPAATATDKPAEQTTAPVDAGKIAAEVRTAERARISGILGCEEAKGRPTLAQHLASNTDLSVEAAKSTLAASPLESVAAVATFSQAMGKVSNPKVGTDGGPASEDDADALARRIAGVAPANATTA